MLTKASTFYYNTLSTLFSLTLSIALFLFVCLFVSEKDSFFVFCVCVQAYLSMNENADKRREAFLCRSLQRKDPDCPTLQKDRS